MNGFRAAGFSSRIGAKDDDRVRNPEKYKARNAVGNALRDGRLTKQPCRICGSKVGVQAHHTSYSRPLDVLWECFKCHREKEHG